MEESIHRSPRRHGKHRSKFRIRWFDRFKRFDEFGFVNSRIRQDKPGYGQSGGSADFDRFYRTPGIEFLREFPFTGSVLTKWQTALRKIEQ